MCALINISKIENGFAIKFPFDLKDNFRSNFKSAKWNAAEKQWEVGSRSGKKLDISIEEAKRLGAVMSRVHKNVDRVSKEKFEDARLQVREMRNALRLAGLRCYAIDFIASANVNRPDRDGPAFLKESDWLKISKYEEA